MLKGGKLARGIHTCTWPLREVVLVQEGMVLMKKQMGLQSRSVGNRMVCECGYFGYFL